jgi:hypothetical protein
MEQSPRCLGELVFGEHSPRLGGQSAKKSELLARKLDFA